jgi:hypothetical protein
VIAFRFHRDSVPLYRDSVPLYRDSVPRMKNISMILKRNLSTFFSLPFFYLSSTNLRARDPVDNSKKCRRSEYQKKVIGLRPHKKNSLRISPQCEQIRICFHLCVEISKHFLNKITLNN